VRLPIVLLLSYYVRQFRERLSPIPSIAAGGSIWRVAQVRERFCEANPGEKRLSHRAAARLEIC